MWKKLSRQTGNKESTSFLNGLHWIEQLVAKALSLAMVCVILVAVCDLGIYLSKEVLRSQERFLGYSLINIFGLFLNILIALEILENITAYLRKNVIQVELVVVTSIIAVSRKIIILDFEKTTGLDIIGLAAAIFALSFSYWLIRASSERT